MEKHYINKNLRIKGDAGSGRFAWRSPSNIAIVKYWGKYGVQLPSNPSLSFTLSEATTTMDLSWAMKDKPSENIEIDFFFENKEAPKFKAKIENFLNSIQDVFPFLKQLELEFNSTNTFPHSAGIASSASSMSALALCLCSLEKEIFDGKAGELSDRDFLHKASYIARLGSGSACRSLYPHAATWGEFGQEGSSQFYASAYTKLHEVFKTYCDSILIVSSGEKPVSSRAGHALMKDHPFSDVRFSNARANLDKLTWALENGELDEFGQILESEALELHGLMMNSNPSFILMRPNTLSIIEKVRAFRAQTNCPLYFTLDAGPNVHLLYPKASEKQVRDFIQSDLLEHCEGQQVIHDFVGTGPLDL